MRESFSLQDYRRLLQDFKTAGYSFCKFQDATSIRGAPYVILRHDVDWSVRGAWQLAEVESEEGIQSSFFFLLRSPFYNCLSEQNHRLISDVKNGGHDVALHMDLSLYGNSYNEYVQGLRDETEVFSSFFPYANIEIISFHRPNDIVELAQLRLPGVSHTYEHRFVAEITYISDSGGAWKYGHPTSSTAFRIRDPIQLLTHPLWWTENGTTPAEKFSGFLTNNRLETIENLKNSVRFHVDL